ncbi:MAG: NADH-quinone oxidoreductase subunit G [Gammaproteobacteria bacterium]|nr:NADH-quinone oxidoreductase subunit G [Gammaproteobacteria bacterium]
MSDDRIKIEVDGQTIEARKGAMLIEATDAAGIYVPRFCYHKHLSVAANCRMCLVEVERAPKCMPACATPVMDGMKVFTRSPKATAAQHATMEFLLINHPLDCPICDQGGECELQDLAMGYGGDVSQFTERKRVVRDKNIGPLVQTDMTRCIHCTRCVRFGEEIAGLRELGATGRGEHMEIGTYVAKAMTSELSGNVIDLCPVGALTNKPYRYSARAWELQQRDGVAPHDALGANVHFHVKGSTVKRVVPKENAAVNATWLSDRDRYSYLGMNHEARLLAPRIKRDGRWSECDWETALSVVADKLRTVAASDADQIAALASPSSTTEEFYLLQRLLRGLGSHNVDHRLRQRDFSDQSAEPLYPGVESLAAIENADAVVLLGSYPRHENPLLNLALRKAALKGAAVMQIGSHAQDFNYSLSGQVAVKPSQLLGAVAALAAGVASRRGAALAAPTAKLVEQSAVNDAGIDALAERLAKASRPLVLLGAAVDTHPLRSALVQVASALAQVGGAVIGELAEGANAAGAWLAGAVPHRGPAGRVLEKPGRTARAMLEQPRKAYVLLGVDPLLDVADSPALAAALGAAEFVVAVSAFENANLEALADIILPSALYGENEGSFVNLTGRWQRFAPAVKPRGDARAAWKILRVLGAKLDLPGFDAVTVEDVTREIEALVGQVKLAPRLTPTLETSSLKIDSSRLELLVEVPMYASDALVRHAGALQQMPQAGDDCVRVSAATAAKLGLAAGQRLDIERDGQRAHAPLAIDEGLPDGVCLVHGARAALAAIAVQGAAVTLSAARGEAAA